MNKLWICLGLVALFGVLGHAESETKVDYDYYELIGSDYPNSNIDRGLRNSNSDTIGFMYDADDEPIFDDDYEEVNNVLNNTSTKDLDEGINKEDDERDDIDDYQIEDNRSEVKDEKQYSDELAEDIDDIDVQPKDANDMHLKSDEAVGDNSKESNNDQSLDDINEKIEDPRNYNEETFEEEASEDVENIADDMSLWNSPVEIKMSSMKESNNRSGDDILLNNDDKDTFSNIEEYYDDISDDELVDLDDNLQNAEKMNDDIKNTIEKNETLYDAEIDVDGRLKLSSISTENAYVNTSDKDTTGNSLESNPSTSTSKYNIDEDTLAKVYSDLPDFDEINSKFAGLEQAAQEDEHDYEVLYNKDRFTLFRDTAEKGLVDEMDEIEEKEADEVEPTLPTSEDLNSDFPAKVESDQAKLIQYLDDALIANEGTKISPNDNEISSTTTSHVVQEHQVEPLEDTSNNELNALSKIEWEKESVDPIRITLSLDKPVVLTSPNYPQPYPTNALIDWILEGEGRGIEFNITQLELNSNAGDFVMIKPGRVDPSGSDGFLLSYSLNTPRAFRFLNVDRMFIRFESMQGLNRFRGFSFSMKLINSVSEERGVEPEAPPIGYPASTITLNLGGVTLDGFLQVEEDFRRIVADMAAMYIEENQIEPGLNTTLEVTQIASTALCFHNWPQFERCAEVRFGVPLQYEDEETEPRLNEEDLRDMWITYSSQNPFALRLQRLGIKDFQIPNDNNVLMVWLVIAAGVVISMAMLAFALWRFSCFEDYTRMPAFSDTESVTEKKTLDLYPTPHQTLPPLYSDTEYKWGEAKYDDSTRVDMGGFANRSYVRTEDYDFDSEEDVAVPARDRFTTDV